MNENPHPVDPAAKPRSSRARKVAIAGLAGGLALAGAAVVGPMAWAATDNDTSTTASRAFGDRVSHIKDALKGLVSDGTLTQEQADKVATTLDQQLPQGGPGGMGGHGGMGRGPGGGPLSFDTAAQTLNMSADELRTELQKGTTLAKLAEQKGVAKDTLIDKLVAAAKDRLATDVKEGRLTQAQADQISANLKDHITTEVEQGFRGRGQGRMMGGGRGDHGDGFGRGHGSRFGQQGGQNSGSVDPNTDPNAGATADPNTSASDTTTTAPSSYVVS